MRARPDRQNEAPDISVEALKYRVGDVVAEKYRLEEVMGQGAMGTVWRARNLALDVDVAVKLIHGELVSPETIERLEREAHAAARLEHPSAVRVFDLGQTDLGDPFIVMEVLRGESLFDILDRKRKLSPQEAVPLLLPVMSALAAAHAKGIIHRDLKPDNIVIVPQEEGMLPKLVDFGIAVVDSPRYERRSTTAGTIIGSPDYMSPEQARGEDKIDARTDVWSMGVVLYETIAGQAPFIAPQPLALIRAIIESEPPTLLSLGAADEKLSAVMQRALAKDISQRFPDMRSFGRALAEWAVSVEIDTDVTGASIAAMWLRGRSPGATTGSLRPGERGSLPSLPPIIGASMPPAERGSQVPTTSPAVWTPSGRRPSSVWRPIAAVGAAALVVVGVVAAVMFVRKAGPGSATATGRTADGPSAASTATQTETSTATSAVANATREQPIASASNATSASASSAPASSASASSDATSTATGTPPVADVPSCVATLFPADTFEDGAPLSLLCTETDPRKGTALLHSEIARHGLLHRKTTPAMRSWATLSWYELGALAVVRGVCCPAQGTNALVVPPTLGVCPPLDGALDALAAAAKKKEGTEKAISLLKDGIECVARSQHENGPAATPYGYKEPPGAAGEVAFRELLGHATARP